jgi:hypothetical protein
VKELARRYYVATGTNEGRRRIATVVLMVAVSINLVAGLLPMTTAYRPAALALYGVGCGLIVVCIVMYWLNRKAP